MQASMNDQPNQLLACSGIHLSLLPNTANTITPMAPLMQAPMFRKPMALISLTKNFWSGPAHRKKNSTMIIARMTAMAHSVKKNWVATIKGGIRKPRISS
uniref:(northern house mosquito) hypothetical protein n=1 Tax=Culex pipiens TaxID=7175 RepID=A0A8D8FRW0_CULPI